MLRHREILLVYLPELIGNLRRQLEQTLCLLQFGGASLVLLQQAIFSHDATDQVIAIAGSVDMATQQGRHVLVAAEGIFLAPVADSFNLFRVDRETRSQGAFAFSFGFLYQVVVDAPSDFSTLVKRGRLDTFESNSSLRIFANHPSARNAQVF